MYNNQNNENDNNEYWFQDINILLDTKRLGFFFPTSEMTYPEKTNALVRGSIYLGIILAVFFKNYIYLYIPILMMGFTYVMHLLKKINNDSDKKAQEIRDAQNRSIKERENQDKVRNEHLNISSNEKFRNSNYMKVIDGIDHQKFKDEQKIRNENWNKRKCLESTVDNPMMNPNPFSSRNIGPNCSPLSEETSSLIKTNLNKRIFKDGNDIFDHRNGNRQFYTVPGNTFPNDRDTFMRWCYSRPPTCKEGNGAQCVANQYYSLREKHTGTNSS